MARRFGRPPSTAGYQTQQTVQVYEEALSRHTQKVRWMKSIRCPCVNANSSQPNPKCSVCYGRGFIYKPPVGPFHVLDEMSPHDAMGKIYQWYQYLVLNTVRVRMKGVWQIIDPLIQPIDGSYIQLSEPYPRNYYRLFTSYSFDPTFSVVNEDSEVYSPNVLRTIETRTIDKGKTFEGTILSVSRVYNVTKTESYVITGSEKEFIYLLNMGTWVSGDVLQVDYKYVKPFDLLVVGVTPKMRYEQPWIMEESDALIMTPYWVKPSPNDLFTALSQEQRGEAIIEPKVGDDEVRNYFDISSVVMIVDKSGVEYSPLTSVSILARNKIHWLVTKPTVPYTIQFTYHPTYTSISNYSAIRTAENKEFINRINVRLFDRINERRI